MKYLLFNKNILLLSFFLSLQMMSQKLQTKLDSLSYALGVNSSEYVNKTQVRIKKGFGLTLNKSAYMLGFEDVIDSKKVKIDIEKSKIKLINFFKEQRELSRKSKTPISLPISSDSSLKTKLDSVSYALGIQKGYDIIVRKEKIKNIFDVNLSVDFIKKGHNAGINSLNVKISEAESSLLLYTFLENKQKEIGTKNKKEGEEFLVKNKTKKGVITTTSGLQYTVINEGFGKKPTLASKVKVHYHGTLIDGRVFDSSVDEEQPVEFPLKRVIKGWTEGLQLMKKGAKYRFYIPQNLAYGPKGVNVLIKPYSTLIFDVELLDVK